MNDITNKIKKLTLMSSFMVYIATFLTLQFHLPHLFLVFLFLSIFALIFQFYTLIDYLEKKDKKKIVKVLLIICIVFLVLEFIAIISRAFIGFSINENDVVLYGLNAIIQAAKSEFIIFTIIPIFPLTIFYLISYVLYKKNLKIKINSWFENKKKKKRREEK
jgi:hypothetical protein